MKKLLNLMSKLPDAILVLCVVLIGVIVLVLIDWLVRYLAVNPVMEIK